MVQQSSSTSTYYAFAFNREFILVRNGIRVEPVNKIISFKGQNPFKEKVDNSTEAIFNEMMKTSAAYTRNLYLNMPKSQKKQLVESYINMGLPREQIAIYTGLNSDEINEFMDIKNGHEIEIPLLETENIYSVKDLMVLEQVDDLEIELYLSDEGPPQSGGSVIKLAFVRIVDENLVDENSSYGTFDTNFIYSNS